LATGDVIDFVILLGNVLDLGTPSDGTVTNAKLAQDIISGETALAVAPADTDEFLVSDAGTLKRIDYSLIKSANTPAFFAYEAGSGQAISDATWTKVSFDTESFDTDSKFASDRFTTTSSGKWLITASIKFENTGGAMDSINIKLMKNGSTDLTESPLALSGNYVQDTVAKTITQIVTSDGDDYWEVYAWMNTSGGGGNEIQENSFFSGFKLIGV
jgi:hypothetical protein